MQNLSEDSFRLWHVQENTVRDDRNPTISMTRVRPSTLLKRSMEMCCQNKLETALESDRNVVFLEIATDSGGPIPTLEPYDDNRTFD